MFLLQTDKFDYAHEKAMIDATEIDLNKGLTFCHLVSSCFVFQKKNTEGGET